MKFTLEPIYLITALIITVVLGISCQSAGKRHGLLRPHAQPRNCLKRGTATMATMGKRRMEKGTRQFTNTANSRTRGGN